MDYQKEALRTLSTQFHVSGVTQHLADHTEGVTPELLHGGAGLVTEAGEFMDALKKAIFYGAELDRTNLIEELGDLEWSMAIIRDVLDVSQDDVQRINIEKLCARYPEKFTSEAANNRDLDTERAILEQG